MIKNGEATMLSATQRAAFRFRFLAIIATSTYIPTQILIKTIKRIIDIIGTMNGKLDSVVSSFCGDLTL